MGVLMKEIRRHLSKDKLLKRIIESVPLKITISENNLYEDLMRSIISQQLSVKAAATIYGRFLDMFSTKSPFFDQVIAVEIGELRKAGLSMQKAGYVKNVANFALENPRKRKDWAEMSDEEIILFLTQIKGVGKWTAQMILMFNLGRPDVFPVDDLGIQQAIKGLYGLEEQGKKLKPKLFEIAENWKPYRTTACYYLWRWKDAQ